MITFQTLRWKNFISTGNFFTEIQLNRSNNTLVVGTNGAGKSTMLDALCFVLFGKPFRKINKPQLVNSINDKDCLVEIEFMIGDKQYKVIRGIKPNVFEIYCNNVMVNQDAKVKDYQEHLEKLILKLNFKTFTQVVILGSASFVPFMQLSPADRRTIIEDLLDIEIFSTMNVLLKQKLSANKDNITTSKSGMELLAEKIKLQKENIEVHKRNNEEDIAKKRQDVANNEIQAVTITEEITTITTTVTDLLKSIENSETIQKKSSKLVQLESQMETRVKKLEKDISFFHDNDNCPTCKQGLEHDFKTGQITTLATTKQEVETGLVEINKQIQEVNDELNFISNVNKDITNHNLESAKKWATLQSIQKYIKNLEAEIVELEQKKDNIENNNEHLKELKEQLGAAIEHQKELITEKQYFDFASGMLKDSGIKTRIIKQYLPVMNKLINMYLTSMNFFVNFNIDENFEETIKSRYRDAFSYYNFSEGEKFRIDVALLLTWRQIARLKNSVNTNLLILDEVFDSSLDTGGTDEFMKLIYDLGQDTNVFVISHKGDQLFDKFRSVIRFEKKNNFSQVAK
jgi:DNA repair exonuclease SbcCD ATPase subunit